MTVYVLGGPRVAYIGKAGARAARRAFGHPVFRAFERLTEPARCRRSRFLNDKVVALQAESAGDVGAWSLARAPPEVATAVERLSIRQLAFGCNTVGASRTRRRQPRRQVSVSRRPGPRRRRPPPYPPSRPRGALGTLRSVLPSETTNAVASMVARAEFRRSVAVPVFTSSYCAVYRLLQLQPLALSSLFGPLHALRPFALFLAWLGCFLTTLFVFFEFDVQKHVGSLFH